MFRSMFNYLSVIRMGSVNLVVIVESAQSLITSNGDLKEFHIPSIVAVAAALGKHPSKFSFAHANNP